MNQQNKNTVYDISDHLREMKSINKLLQIAQSKDIYEQEDQDINFQEFSPKNNNNPESTVKNRWKNYSLSLKKEEQDRIFNRIDQQQLNHQKYSNYFNEQLRYNSSEKEDQSNKNSSYLPKMNSIKPNATFYGSMDRRVNKQSDFQETFHYIRGNDLSSAFAIRQRKPKNNVIFLKANKSQTVRQVLNQMKQSKAKNKKVILNPLMQEQQEDNPQSYLFSDYQMKQMRKYKNFVPFREDERLLIQKIGQRESVWKRRFKQSWQKRKHDQEIRKYYLQPSTRI